MKRCFEANLAIFKTVNFAQPHRKFCRLLHVSLVLPGCGCLMGNLDFKFPSLCLYPTPMNAGKSIKKLVEEFALAWSRKPALWRRRMGQKASILIWDQNPSLGDPGSLALEGEISVALHAGLSALIFLEDGTGDPEGSICFRNTQVRCRQVRGWLISLCSCH